MEAWSNLLPASKCHEPVTFEATILPGWWEAVTFLWYLRFRIEVNKSQACPAAEKKKPLLGSPFHMHIIISCGGSKIKAAVLLSPKRIMRQRWQARRLTGGSRHEKHSYSTKSDEAWLIKKSPSSTPRYFGYEYELYTAINYYSIPTPSPVGLRPIGHFLTFPTIFTDQGKSKELFNIQQMPLPVSCHPKEK